MVKDDWTFHIICATASSGVCVFELKKSFMDRETPPLKIDVYYDFSCPWCYVGFLRCHEVNTIYWYYP